MAKTHPEWLTEGWMVLTPQGAPEGLGPIQLLANNLPQCSMETPAGIIAAEANRHNSCRGPDRNWQEHQ